MSGEGWDKRYDAILYRPHPVSQEHPSMPLLSRAAQFAAFQALTGFEEEIDERGRYTQTENDPDESRIAELDGQLRRLLEKREGEREVEFLWFRPDERKEGGEYRRTRGVLKTVDGLAGMLLLTNGARIPLAQLRGIEEL